MADAPISFTATTGAEGVELRGVIADERMGAAVASFATARFGPADSGLSVREDTPPGWTQRVLAGSTAAPSASRPR